MDQQFKRYAALAFWVALGLVQACAPPQSTEPTSLDPTDTDSGVVAPARSADAFVHSIGVNLHVSYFQTVYGTGWESIIKPRIQELGIRHVRDKGTVTSNDSWMEEVYSRMKDLAATGVKFDLILSPVDDGTNYSSAAHIDRLMQYAGPAVESFEGLNEHDLSGRTNWVTEVRTFQQAIWTKLKSNPSTHGLPVFGPSMGNVKNSPKVGDLSTYLEYAALHPYPGADRPMAVVSTNISYARNISGNRPQLATESGYHTAIQWTGAHPPVSEEAMGRYIPRLYLDYFNAGFAKSYIYELIDEGTSMSHREEAFGLLRVDGTPKPAFTSLKNLIAVLSDPGPAFTPGGLSYQLSGDITNVRHMLLQKRNGKFYLVLWYDAWSYTMDQSSTAPPSNKVVTLTLTRESPLIRTFATLTSAAVKAQWTAASSATFSVPDSPLVVEITP